MQTPSYIVQNRFNTFYFRIKTPKSIIHLLPHIKKEVKISLLTKSRSVALQKAREHKIGFDRCFKEISNMSYGKNVVEVSSDKPSFDELPFHEQEHLIGEEIVKQRIEDQHFVHYLYFLFERKKQIKKLFNNIKELNNYSLSDIDFSSAQKINKFISIVDLLSDPTLDKPHVYIDQIPFKESKPALSYEEMLAMPSDKAYKAIKIDRLVLNKDIKPLSIPNTPQKIKKHHSKQRKELIYQAIRAIDKQLEEGVDTLNIDIHTPEKSEEDIVLEGVTLDNENDAASFAKLISSLTSGQEMEFSDNTGLTPVTKQKSSFKVSEVFSKFYDERSKEWSNRKTHTTNLAIYELFIEIVGDIYIRDLSYDHTNHFVETIQKLPPNRNKSKLTRDLSVTQILEITDQFTPMRSINCNKYISRVSEAFEYAKQRGYIQENLLKGVKIKAKNQNIRQRDERQRFDEQDLNAIFNSGYYINESYKRTYMYWLPLLGLYTGARLQELSQLRLGDIYKAENMWVIDINETNSEATGKSLKTVNAKRLIPVHKTLLSLKFDVYVDYLQSMYNDKKLESDLLFPDLLKGRDGWGHNSAKWFSRFLTQINVKENGKSYHSFRHTFADELKQDLKVKDLIIDELLGHASKSEASRRYGKDYRLPIKKTAINTYQPLSEDTLKAIKKFTFWKEFNASTMSTPFNNMHSKTKSIYKDKNLVKALIGRLPSVEV